MELCPQGSCDLVQQVVLSFSAALPGVPTAAYPCFCRDGASHITPFPTPPTQKSPHYTQLSSFCTIRNEIPTFYHFAFKYVELTPFWNHFFVHFTLSWRDE